MPKIISNAVFCWLLEGGLAGQIGLIAAQLLPLFIALMEAS
jgi:hypothetical protein